MFAALIKATNNNQKGSCYLGSSYQSSSYRVSIFVLLDKSAIFVYNYVDNQHTFMARIGTIIRVSVSEGAKLLGISSRTVRRAIADKEPIAFVVIRGRYKLNLESLLRWSDTKPTVRNKLKSVGIGQFVEKWKLP